MKKNYRNSLTIKGVVWKYALFLLLGCCLSFSYVNNPRNAVVSEAVSIEFFGAIAGDTSFDNAPAITKAIKSANTILIPPSKEFTIRSTIVVQGLSNKIIVAKGATIINRNYDVRTMFFVDCKNIKVEGGKYTRNILPQVQNGKDQSTLGFKNSNNVSVTNVHIDNSPEMGIDNNNIIGGTFARDTIEHCLRDGIYAHYSANLNYLHNVLNEIKDDALSMHDYGLDDQKQALHAAGYTQAGHSVIAYNQISNSIQGISSIGCTDLQINHNIITNTVNAGICIFNSDDLYPGSTARVNRVTITGNKLMHNDFAETINRLSISNNAQIASGRAAIFIACHADGKAFNISDKRSSNVSVSGNTITECAVNGATFYNIDGLVCSNNSFTNCHSSAVNKEYTGNIVEIINCTKINFFNNSVSDERTPPMHNRAYDIQNSSGRFQKSKIAGYTIEAVRINSSKLQENN